MNLESINKWLDEEYGVSYTRLEELHDFVVEQDLKHREEKDKEIERLHSIIKEARQKIHDIYFRIDNIPQNYWIGIKLDVTNQGQELLEILDKEK